MAGIELQALQPLELNEAEIVSQYISTLGTAHCWSHMREERDALYHLLATRLSLACRCEQSSGLLGSLMEALPLDACNGSSESNSGFDMIFDRMNSEAKHAKPSGTLDYLPFSPFMRLSTEPRAAPQWAALVAADCSIVTALCNMERVMLDVVCEDTAIISGARAVLEGLVVQARYPSPCPS